MTLFERVNRWLASRPHWRQKAMETVDLYDRLAAENKRLRAARPAKARDDKLLHDWAALSKGLQLYRRNGEVADFDDELASLLADTALATLRWRDGGGAWSAQGIEAEGRDPSSGLDAKRESPVANGDAP